MRKFIVMCGIVGSLAMSVIVAAPDAAAQGGCKEFGQAVSSAAQAEGPFGQRVKVFAPVNEDFAEAKEFLCV